jgi:hypothetical protein
MKNGIPGLLNLSVARGFFLGIRELLKRVEKSSVLQVSAAPPGLTLILRRFPGVPFGHPRLAYKPAKHLTVAPSGG